MKLKRTQQCAKCPWRKTTNPHDIPNGYDVQKHRALACTIAAGNGSDWLQMFNPKMYIMACHEEESAHCIGWLVNQLGSGNNIALRMAMRNCENLNEVRVTGEQHEFFKDTIPI